VIAPVTPCAPKVTVAFVEARFGPAAAAALDAGSRLARIRQRRIIELRRCGELRHAERYGWLSLAAWLVGMKAVAVERIDPTSDAIWHRARAADVLPDPFGYEETPALERVGETDLKASNPRDMLGFHVVELAAAAVGEGVVQLDQRQVGGGAAAAALRWRLEKTARD